MLLFSYFIFLLNFKYAAKTELCYGWNMKAKVISLKRSQYIK